MDDLQQLKDALSTESSDLINLLAGRLEATASDGETAALVQSFWEVLQGEEEEEGRSERMRATLETSSLEVVPLLSPLLSRPPPVSLAAQQVLLDGVAVYSSPRELMLTVGERIEALVDLAEAEQDDAGEMGNEDEDEDDHSQHNHSHGHTHHTVTRPSPAHALATELPTLINLLTISIPRLSSKKSLPTLLNLSNLFESILPVIPLHPAATRPAMSAIGELVLAAYTWAKTTADWHDKGEQSVSSILTNLLASSLVALYPGLEVRSAEFALVPSGPQAIGFSDNGWREGMNGLLSVVELISASTMPSSGSPTFLLPLLTSTSQDISLLATFLLANHLSTLSAPQDFYSAVPSTLPSDAFTWLQLLVQTDIISAAGVGGVALVSKTISAILSSPTTPSSTEAGPVYRAVFQAYLPPLATHPSPVFRQRLFALLSSLVQPSALDPSSSLSIILSLLSPENSLPMLRTVALHFLGGLLGSPKLASLAWLKGEPLRQLSECAFRVPFASDTVEGQDEQLGNGLEMFLWDAEDDQSGEGWVRGPGPAFVVLALGLYLRLITKDVKDESGIRSTSHRQETFKRWLAPLRKHLDQRGLGANGDEEEEEGEAESAGAFSTVEFALEQVEQALAKL